MVRIRNIARLWASPFHGLFHLIAIVTVLPTLCLAVFADSVFAESGFADWTSADNSRPNIVVIISDDQGWADIGYNNTKVYSPNLDALAKGGLVFKQHYVMPQCTPTRVALMTGRFPSRFGNAALQASNAPAFPLGTTTMASMLKSQGYETFLCGKWHLGSTPEHGPRRFGFDHSYGSLAGAVGMYDHRYRPGEFYETWYRDDELVEGFENGRHATDLVTDEAVKIIHDQRDSPLFLFVPYHSVHTPLDERGDFTNRPTQLDPDNSKRWLDEDEITWFNDPQGLIQSESDPEKRLLLAAVNHMDDCIGRIVKALDETGQRENTLILFSSDNGPQVNWNGNAYPDDLKLTDFNQPLPFRGKKIDVWEGGIHVPGLANWPGTIDQGESDQLVHIVDWLPTLAKLCAGQNEQAHQIPCDGVDLSGVLLRGEQIADRDLYWVWGGGSTKWALRHGDWKVVKNGKGAPAQPADWGLFNLADDPQESKNLAESNPEMLNQMHEKFLKQRAADKKSVQN